MLGSPILDSSLNGCGGGNGSAGGAVGGGADLADCYSPKLNDSYRGTTLDSFLQLNDEVGDRVNLKKGGDSRSTMTVLRVNLATRYLRTCVPCTILPRDCIDSLPSHPPQQNPI